MAMSSSTSIRSATVMSESAGVTWFMAGTVGPRYRVVIPHGYRSGARRHRKPAGGARAMVAQRPPVAHSMVMFAFMPAL